MSEEYKETWDLSYLMDLIADFFDINTLSFQDRQELKRKMDGFLDDFASDVISDNSCGEPLPWGDLD